MFLIDIINNRRIVLKGIGEHFYKNGFPIALSINEFNKKDIDVSVLHITDELLKNGWSPKTVISKLKEELNREEYKDWETLEKFCYASYEDQRDMIFNYLFTDMNTAKEFLLNKLEQ